MIKGNDIITTGKDNNSIQGAVGVCGCGVETTGRKGAHGRAGERGHEDTGEENGTRGMNTEGVHGGTRDRTLGSHGKGTR